MTQHSSDFRPPQRASLLFRLLFTTVIVLTGTAFGPLPGSATHGGLHALFARDLGGAANYSPTFVALPGDILFLVLKSDTPVGPTQIPMGSLASVGAVTTLAEGPWRLVSRGAPGQGPIDTVEWDTDQSDAAVFRLQVAADTAVGDYEILDARLTVAARAPAPNPSPQANRGPIGATLLRSNASQPPPDYVSGLDQRFDPGWLVIQCYCWRGDGVKMPTINLREERGDWSYSFVPTAGVPTIFTDLPTDVGMIVELGDTEGTVPGQPTRWDGVYVADHGLVIYFIVN